MLYHPGPSLKTKTLSEMALTNSLIQNLPTSQFHPPKKETSHETPPPLPVFLSSHPAVYPPTNNASVGAGVCATQSLALSPSSSWLTKGANDTSLFEQERQISVSQGLISSEKDSLFGAENAEKILLGAWGQHSPRDHCAVGT